MQGGGELTLCPWGGYGRGPFRTSDGRYYAWTTRLVQRHTRHTSQFTVYTGRDKEARRRNVALGHVQTKDMEDARRSAQKAIAAIPHRSEVKLVTCAQPSEAGS